MEKDLTDLSPTRAETNNKTGPSSEVLKLGTSDLMASNVNAPEECVTFDVQTRNDLEVKIPKDSEVKTPETPKAKEAEENEVNFSDNWEVKFPEELESKFPEELEAKKTSEVVKVAEVSDQVSSPKLSEIKVTKESDVPEDLEDKNIPEVSEVSAPQLSEIKVTKESDVPQVLEDKNIPDVSEVKNDEVEAAESELLKVSEVKSSEALEIKVPKVFEVKTPELSNVKGTDESEVKTGQEAVKAKIEEETEVPEFVDAKEKIEKSDQDKEIVLPKTDEDEEKDVSLEKQVKESTLSDLENK